MQSAIGTKFSLDRFMMNLSLHVSESYWLKQFRLHIRFGWQVLCLTLKIRAKPQTQ